MPSATTPPGSQRSDSVSMNAGWYPDVTDSSMIRYHDGRAWTQLTAPKPAGPQVVSADQLGEPPTEAAKYKKIPTSDVAGQLAETTTAGGKSSRRSNVGRRAVQAAAACTLAASLGLLSFSAWENIGSNWYTAHVQEDLREEYNRVTFAGAQASPGLFKPFPAASELDKSVAAGRILIPSLKVDQIVVVGSSSASLRRGPGLWEYGVFPGAAGNATIAGHRTTYGSPFRNIDQLQAGDQIVFKAAGRADAVFEVRESRIVRPSQVSVTAQTPGVRLTLTTCDPVGSSADRLVVQAELVSGVNQADALDTASWSFQV